MFIYVFNWIHCLSGRQQFHWSLIVVELFNTMFFFPISMLISCCLLLKIQEDVCFKTAENDRDISNGSLSTSISQSSFRSSQTRTRKVSSQSVTGGPGPPYQYYNYGLVCTLETNFWHCFQKEPVSKIIKVQIFQKQFHTGTCPSQNPKPTQPRLTALRQKLQQGYLRSPTRRPGRIRLPADLIGLPSFLEHPTRRIV